MDVSRTGFEASRAPLFPAVASRDRAGLTNPGETPIGAARARRRTPMRLAGRLLSARPLSTSAFGGAAASAAAQLTFTTWHSAVTAAMSGAPDEAMAQLRTRMQPECIFRPPTYFKPWTGRDETLLLLSAVSEVFGPSFRYKVHSRATFPPPRSLTPAPTLCLTLTPLAPSPAPMAVRRWARLGSRIRGSDRRERQDAPRHRPRQSHRRRAHR